MAATVPCWVCGVGVTNCEYTLESRSGKYAMTVRVMRPSGCRQGF